jgi:oxaloacetate decarboxylase alpha subunit
MTKRPAKTPATAKSSKNGKGKADNNTISFVDVTIRDGHQSLWAESMTTGMMLPIAENLDNAGFEAIELISSSHVKKAVRELHENPWDRIRLVSQRIKKTPLRLIAGRLNTFGHEPPALYQLFLDRMGANGISQLRISEPWNDYEGWKRRRDAADHAGMDSIINLIYSISPRHTDEYYAQRCRQAVSLKPMRLCLKDPGGILTPERIRTLLPIIQKNSGGIPIELHSHCTTGLGPLVALEAIKLGVRIINTAIPPLADDASLPSIFNVAANARALGYKTKINEELLKPVSEHFYAVARREGFPLGKPAEYDEGQYIHQVPGGMISNLRHQLTKVGLGHKVEEALEETKRVRADLGYPIMVTPLSQYVGSQAAINVVVGERYKEVTDQVIRYALGQFGQEGADEMDPDVKDKILNRPRGREIASKPIPEPSLKELRKELGGATDEEMLLRFLLGKDDVDALNKMGGVKEYKTHRHPLVQLVADLASRTDNNHIEVNLPNFSLTLAR